MRRLYDWADEVDAEPRRLRSLPSDYEDMNASTAAIAIVVVIALVLLFLSTVALLWSQL